jgi:transcriptional regulator with XRE-family HTH domain
MSSGNRESVGLEAALTAAGALRIQRRLAANVRRERERSGLTQEALATLIRCDRQTISRIENAKTDPGTLTLVALALALRVQLGSLEEGLLEEAQDGAGSACQLDWPLSPNICRICVT